MFQTCSDVFQELSDVPQHFQIFLNMFRVFPTSLDFPNILGCFQTCSDFQIFSGYFPTCSGCSRRFQILSNIFRCASQTRSDVPNMFRSFPTFSDVPNIFRLFTTFSDFHNMFSVSRHAQISHNIFIFFKHVKMLPNIFRSFQHFQIVTNAFRLFPTFSDCSILPTGFPCWDQQMTLRPVDLVVSTNCHRSWCLDFGTV